MRSFFRCCLFVATVCSWWKGEKSTHLSWSVMYLRWMLFAFILIHLVLPNYMNFWFLFLVLSNKRISFHICSMKFYWLYLNQNGKFRVFSKSKKLWFIEPNVEINFGNLLDCEICLRKHNLIFKTKKNNKQAEDVCCRARALSKHGYENLRRNNKPLQ